MDCFVDYFIAVAIDRDADWPSCVRQFLGIFVFYALLKMKMCCINCRYAQRT